MWGENGEGWGQGHGVGGGPQRPGHGGPGVASYLQGLGDRAVARCTFGCPRDIEGLGDCRDRGLSGDMGGPGDPAAGEG